MGKNYETSCKNNVKYHLIANKEIKDFLFLQHCLPMTAYNRCVSTINV